MSTMSQQIGEATGPLPEIPSLSGNDLRTTSRRLKTLLKALASILFAPLLLVVGLAVFLIVVADFSYFRLREIRYGHPQPKGLWEF